MWLKVMAGVLQGRRTQVEAARLLAYSERQVRRIARRLEQQGDRGVVHRSRGRPGNRRKEAGLQAAGCWRRTGRITRISISPTPARSWRAEVGIHPETLRLWLLEAGLWKRNRRRDTHRTRRERRACRGELVQMDASEHKWLEDRYAGPIELLAMIDDATNQITYREHRREHE